MLQIQEASVNDDGDDVDDGVARADPVSLAHATPRGPRYIVLIDGMVSDVWRRTFVGDNAIR
jgi:hypothetical protein